MNQKYDFMVERVNDAHKKKFILSHLEVVIWIWDFLAINYEF